MEDGSAQPSPCPLGMVPGLMFCISSLTRRRHTGLMLTCIWKYAAICMHLIAHWYMQKHSDLTCEQDISPACPTLIYLNGNQIKNTCSLLPSTSVFWDRRLHTQTLASQAWEQGKHAGQRVWWNDSMTQIMREYKGAIVLTITVSNISHRCTKRSEAKLNNQYF